jgi:hypothetical protein
MLRQTGENQIFPASGVHRPPSLKCLGWKKKKEKETEPEKEKDRKYHCDANCDTLSRFAYIYFQGRFQ